MTADEKRRQKAKALRYKKPISAHMNYSFLVDELCEMQEVIEDVKWYCDTEEDNLLHALDDDEEEAYEFKMAFHDLSYELEQFQEDLSNEYIPDCFDDLFPAAGYGDLIGWDTYECDYFGLEPYEYGWAEKEAEKRILRMTKKELLEAVGACLKVYQSYMALRYRYDCLEASLEIIRAQNLELLKLFREIEEQYDKAEESSHHFEYKYDNDVIKLDSMLEQIPGEYWIQ